MLSDLLKCISDNVNVLEVLCFSAKKEIWLIVKDNNYNEYKSIIKSCYAFQEKYSSYEYLVLRKEQINFDEIPKADIELKRYVDE